ncbi:RNA-guided endonuclease InsQ/TnpB family protein [Halococcus sediminicola]|uniref:RNA-guided endonuclease InsQ/TnpB family protein n=1 Tax=Halococcus sediminicola TaxID=1264579 RepID=UPI000678FF18|nr:RNA-guided endonuclease TnpB family protein [Halococcus sediminicola]
MKKSLRQNLRSLDREEYQILRKMSRLSKNLYNRHLYEVRQHYFDNGEYLNYYNTYNQIKSNENYELLPSQAAQQTMKQADKGFQSFFKLIEKKKEGKYQANCSPPNYLEKDGFHPITFPNQSFQLKEDYIRVGVPKQFREEYGFSRKEIRIPFTYEEVRQSEIKQLQILPKSNAEYFEYRIIYEEDAEEVETEEETFLSIDLGVDNLATCVDHSGRSFILDGRALKSTNRWYNKRRAKLQSIKDKQGIERETNRMQRIRRKRENKIHDYFNKAVRGLVDYCVEHRIEKVIVGDAKGWKKDSDLGDRTNQSFSSIPHDKFKQKLKHKLEEKGIEFKLQNESHTSKCSFLDNEPVEHHEEYVGTRRNRGLFVASDGTELNADVNAAANIARKHKGKPNTELFDSSVDGVESVVNTPERIRKPDFCQVSTWA